jgi:hypothetical protein
VDVVHRFQDKVARHGFYGTRLNGDCGLWLSLFSDLNEHDP